MTASVELN